MNNIIGIDLTGSEKRPSGLAVLSPGNKVDTCRIKSDDDLIATVCDSEAILVSIDSPLSLPENPEKIYRDCELALKRRGIGVYWCLLPSMKNLTYRGISLANRLRDLDYTVIESYPGAAQDVLGIPRKNKGKELLASALLDYGIKGNLNVSHDELDAITAAIVGKLYLEGKCESLGCLVLPLGEVYGKEN